MSVQSDLTDSWVARLEVILREVRALDARPVPRFAASLTALSMKNAIRELENALFHVRSGREQ